VHAAHAAAQRLLDGRALGSMPSARLPAAQFLQILEVHVGDQRARVLRPRGCRVPRWPASASRRQRRGERGGDGVGVDVEHACRSSADSGLTTGIRPLSSWLLMMSASTASMSPTKP
jgi:hypothetical protein